MSSYKNLEALVEKYIHQYQAISLVLESVQQERDEYRDLYSASHEKLEAAERERDELRAIAEEQSKLAGSNAAKAQKSEAEIARRDAADRELLSDELSRLREWLKCVEAERDKAISWHSSLLKKFDNLQAEIARQDASAGEASDRIVDDGDGQQIGGVGVSDRLNCLWPIGTKFYTAAPPAALPPKYADELTELAELIDAYSKTQREIAQELGCDSDNESILKAIYAIKELGAQPAVLLQSDIDRIVPAIDPNGLDEAIHYIEHALYVDRERIRSELKALGAQQQKVVELPDMLSEEFHDYGGNFEYATYQKTLHAELDAANVKYEVKK